MENIIILLLLILGPLVLAFIFSFIKVSVFHIKEGERGVLIKNYTSVKIYSPGWVIMNPFAGKTDVVKINEQKFSFTMGEGFSERFFITYIISDVEEAVKAGAKYVVFLLERSKMSTREKNQILATGKFDPIMVLIEDLIKYFVMVSYVSNKRNYDEKQIGSIDELSVICWEKVKHILMEKGIDILDFQIQQ